MIIRDDGKQFRNTTIYQQVKSPPQNISLIVHCVPLVLLTVIGHLYLCCVEADIWLYDYDQTLSLAVCLQ